MSKQDPAGTKNLLFFTSVSSVWAIIMGLIGPFYVLQVEKLSGGVEKLGIAFGIMTLVQAASTYIAGRFSDKLGRKPFLIATCYVDAAILFLYTIIEGHYQLYALQAMLGISTGIGGTISTSLLGDLTVKEKRGAMVGRFNAFVSLASGIGVSVSGFAVKYYGLKALFYFSSGMIALSSVLLFFIREDWNEKTSGD